MQVYTEKAPEHRQEFCKRQRTLNQVRLRVYNVHRGELDPVISRPSLSGVISWNRIIVGNQDTKIGRDTKKGRATEVALRETAA